MEALYNEHEPYAAAWLRNLIRNGLIAPGKVDERDIRDIKPDDIGDGPFHAFAGIGVWSAALRGAGIPDNWPIWTGSCPCQPWSGVGEQRGFSDERHLWPVWQTLIEKHRPPVIFSEQVSSGGGLAWLDLVQSDLERMGYACGAIVTPAAGFGAPHGRHRIWFVAHTTVLRLEGTKFEWEQNILNPFASYQSYPNKLGNTPSNDANQHPLLWERAEWEENHSIKTGWSCSPDVLVDAESEQARISRFAREHGATTGFWAGAEWIPCRDGKWRPIEPGIEPLAHGVAFRMERLRAYGNAIVLPAAIEFVKAAIAAIQDSSCS